MAHITNEMTDEQIKNELSVPGEKILSEVIRENGDIVGYVWSCDKDGCNCDGSWTDKWR